MGLAGCTEKSAKEQALEKKINELENKIDQGKKAKQSVEVPKSIVVNVIDPNNKKVLRSINPKEMGFGKDDSMYRQELEQWAKELARGSETTPGYDQRNIPDRIGPGRSNYKRYTARDP